MTRVGLHAPYGRQEATHLALTLAQLAEEFGHEVSWLASQSHEPGIHGDWDDRVQSEHRQEFRSWCRRHRCGHVIWFDVQPEKLEISRKQGVTNTLVLLWHHLSEAQAEHLGAFHSVVCPTAEIARQVQSRLPAAQVDILPWDTGQLLKLLPNKDVVPDVLRIFMPVDSYTAQQYGPMLLHNAELLLAGNPGISLTVGQAHNWAQNARYALGGLVASHPQRVRVLKRQNWQDWQAAQGSHHWTFLPSVRCNSNYQALDSLCVGVPVAAFDVPPLDGVIRPGINGTLLPCGLRENWWGVPQAVLHSRDVLRRMEQVFTSHEHWVALRPTTNTGLLERRHDFRANWYRRWRE